jgi:hypothetical protein
MAAHMLDHFVFTARRLSERTKSIVFVIVTAAIVGNFWWFRGIAWGIDGPINDHRGLQWRKVRRTRYTLFVLLHKLIFCLPPQPRFVSRGIFMICTEWVNLFFSFHHVIGVARSGATIVHQNVYRVSGSPFVMSYLEILVIYKLLRRSRLARNIRSLFWFWCVLC